MSFISQLLTRCCILIFVFQIHANAQSSIPKNYEAVAAQVLDNLYVHAGLSKVRKPKIVLNTGKKFGAVYRPLQNEIHLETALVEICRSFKKDSLHALAFIIAHELSHAIFKQQNDINPANFLSIHNEKPGKTEEEKNSDIYGLFLAFISGYAPDRVLNKLIDQIYTTYQLPDTKTRSYPSKEDRKKSDQALLDQVTPLIQLFDAANVLTLKREYIFAALSYEHILNFFRGPEMFNNLGVVYTLRAMENFDENLDVYAYPIELDLNTGLKKVRRSRGALTDEMRIERNNLLLKAREQFEKALQLNPEYNPARVNKLCNLLIYGEISKAIEYYYTITKAIAATKIPDELQMAVGIAYALNKNGEAQKIFSRLCKSKIEKTRRFAYTNLQLFNKGGTQKKESLASQYDCLQWKKLVSSPLTLPQQFTDRQYPIGDANRKISFSYNTYGSGQAFLFRNDDQALLSIERKKLALVKDQAFLPESGWSQANLFWVQTPRGSYIECESSGLLYLLGNKNDFLEEISVTCY